MIPIEDCHYLRWARSQADPPHPEISLVMSGMTPPDSGPFGGFAAGELLQFPVGDHPPLAYRLAEEWQVAPERVLVQPGTHLSLHLLMAARLSARFGPVVVEEPAYEPLWRIPQALGAEIIRWPRPRATGFSLDSGALDRLVAASPSLVVLSNPHNPTGAVLSPADREVVRELQSRTGCALISDEVYLEFLDDPAEHTAIDRFENTAVTRSFTKVFGLGTLRTSATVGPLEWIERTAALTDYYAVALPGPSHAVAHRFWESRHELWARARDVSSAGRAEVLAFAERNRRRVSVEIPEKGIICFPQLSEGLHRACVALATSKGVRGPFGFGLDDAGRGSESWIEDLRRRRSVQLTPGAFFGDTHAFRLGFGIDPGTLREGLRRIEEHWDEAEAMAEDKGTSRSSKDIQEQG